MDELIARLNSTDGIVWRKAAEEVRAANPELTHLAFERYVLADWSVKPRLLEQLVAKRASFREKLVHGSELERFHAALLFAYGRGRMECLVEISEDILRRSTPKAEIGRLWPSNLLPRVPFSTYNYVAMIKLPPYDPDAPVIVIDIGNTNTKVATWHQGILKTVLAAPTSDIRSFHEIFVAHQKAATKQKPAATVIGSVVPDALEKVRRHVFEVEDREPLVIGETLPLPMDVIVKDAKAVGVDRVCQAAAAYDRLKTGCTVVSFGTAVTIDLVDDEGVFVGGAILPGAQLQLLSLNEHTAALPPVEPGVPELPYGTDTREAMQTGVLRGLAGAVRGIVEGYATHLNRWPQVVATGGDAALLMPLCDFIDTWTTDLTLRGIGLAYTNHLAALGA